MFKLASVSFTICRPKPPSQLHPDFRNKPPVYRLRGVKFNTSPPGAGGVRLIELFYLCAIDLHDRGPSTSSASSKTYTGHMAIHWNLHRSYFQDVGFVFLAPNKVLENVISLEQFNYAILALSLSLKPFPYVTISKSCIHCGRQRNKRFLSFLTKPIAATVLYNYNFSSDCVSYIHTGAFCLHYG